MTAQPQIKHPQRIVAIDPGRLKCGVAILHNDGQILFRAIISTTDVVSELKNLVNTYLGNDDAPILIIGNGTGSGPLHASIIAQIPHATLISIDESHTSEEARRRFVQENAPRGWQKLLPRSLRTPDRPYDDYVAVILGRRYFTEQ